ncbi:hypothetical protein L596_028911 [Steinernema carpocapsae]|uniref:Secreted protein n=1 Tax=Steinernema carpocapsae TaxID=34508 RepID=A0A4U5LZQ8_STECR|nr:hypothetical protein L596_028911 [Steinernema carpocapsae]
MRKAIMIKRGSPKALVVLMLILMAKSTDLTQLAQSKLSKYHWWSRKMRDSSFCRPRCFCHNAQFRSARTAADVEGAALHARKGVRGTELPDLSFPTLHWFPYSRASSSPPVTPNSFSSTRSLFSTARTTQPPPNGCGTD